MRLLTGDEEGYRRACADLAERYAGTTDPFTAHALARICALGPEAVADPARLVRWAKPTIIKMRGGEE